MRPVTIALLLFGPGPTTVPEPPATTPQDLMEIALIAGVGLMLLALGVFLIAVGRRTRDRIVLRGPVSRNAHEGDPWNME